MLDEHYEGDGEAVFKHACKLGCEGIVSKRLGSLYRSGRVTHWLKIKNPAAPAVKREAEEEWGTAFRSQLNDARPSPAPQQVDHHSTRVHRRAKRTSRRRTRCRTTMENNFGSREGLFQAIEVAVR